MSAPHSASGPLRLAGLAVLGLAVAVAGAWAAGAETLARQAFALWMGGAAWHLGLRTLSGRLAALALTVAACAALFMVPLFLLLGGGFNSIANRSMAGEAADLGAMAAVTIGLGILAARFLLPRRGHP